MVTLPMVVLDVLLDCQPKVPLAERHDSVEAVRSENLVAEEFRDQTVGNMKALFAQKALYSASPILPQAAFPARGGAAGRPFRHLY